MKRMSSCTGPALCLALWAAGCGKGSPGSDRSAAAPAPPPATAAARPDAAATGSAGPDASVASAAARAVRLPPSAALPGALLLAEEGGTTRIALTAPAALVALPAPGPGLRLYPTAARHGGLVVAIASRDDGDQHGEQLALLEPGAPTAAPRLVGPVAQMVRSPSFSPDGKHLYFEASHKSFRDLYRLELPAELAAPTAGGAAAGKRKDAELEVTRLTDNREGNFTPALSPDGKSLAFASSRDGDSEIYVMDLGGKPVSGRPPVRRLTAFHRDDLAPSFSPAGEVAFLSDRQGVDRLFLVSAAGTDLRRATAEADARAIESSPAWSPSGRLAYLRTLAGRAELRVGTPGTASWQTLTPAASGAGSFAWSPDGEWLAALEVAAPAPGTAPAAVGHGAAASLVVYQAEGKARFEVLAPVGADATVRWIP